MMILPKFRSKDKIGKSLVLKIIVWCCMYITGVEIYKQYNSCMISVHNDIQLSGDSD